MQRVTPTLRASLFAVALTAAGGAGCAERAAAPPPEAPAPLPWPATVSDLAWLTGDWVGEADETCFIERWLPPASGSLIGVARHESADPAPRVTRETMRLMAGDAGLVMVVMLDSGQVTRLPLAAVGADGFLAQRAGDGWPRTIRYARTAGGGLTVTLAGAPNERAVSIPFTRLSPDEAPDCVGRASP